MNQCVTNNLLMVSNYPSDTAYAWWLMEHFWKILAERFVQGGGKAYLAYPKITEISDTIASSPIELVELTVPWQSRDEAMIAQNFIEDNNISSIYFTDQPFFSTQYAILRFKGVRYIVIHDHTPGDRPPIGGVKGLLKTAKNTIPWFSADKLLCVSELMKQRNITNTRIPADKCIVVQNGIRPVVCKNEVNVKLRESLNVGPKSHLIVTTGRAHPYKRFDFIIECAKAVRIQAPKLDVIFLLVGDGPVIPELKKLVRKHDLVNSVRLLGFRNDVRDILCSSDIALHAALGEGFSLSIIEYMSAGLPVLVPDIPSVMQAISHNETGMVYPRDEPEKVAAFIQTLLTDTKRRLAMGNAAKTVANNTYNLGQCTHSFVSAIETAYGFNS